MIQKLLLACLVFLVGCGERPKTAEKICPVHQAEVWDAAISYYLEHGLKPDDLIDPQALTNFFPAGEVPRCPLGTNDYTPFRILDGPKCPYEPDLHAVRRIPARVAKLKGNSP